ATWRLHAQQEILRRGDKGMARGLQHLIGDGALSRETRVAAIFTLAQLLGKASHGPLLDAAEDSAIREWCLRAVADRRPLNEGVSITPFVKALEDTDPRVQVAAAVALGRLGNPAAAHALLDVANPPGNDAAEEEAAPAAPLFVSRKIENRELVEIDADISEAEKLYLVVADGGNGTGNDHGSFFEPWLIDGAGNKTRLTDLKWTSAKAGWGKTRVDKDCSGHPLKDKTGKLWEFGIGCHSTGLIVYDLPKGKYNRFTSMAGNTERGGGRIQFIVDSKKPVMASGRGEVGPHATPNPAILLPHVAIQSLIGLKAHEACLSALGGRNNAAAAWALKYMHDVDVVKGLAEKLRGTEIPNLRSRIAGVLVRLYFEEKPYDGSWWWGTRPDTRGPYYHQGTWEGSPMIQAALEEYWDRKSNSSERALLAKTMAYDRVTIQGI
ncbi:MAG: NPCBM/NEW2 domain-containing protein, partial [Verrucomicrobiota bacterium]